MKSPDPQQGRNELAPGGRGCAKNPVRDCGTTRVNVWLQSRSLPARGRVGLEVHRCLCIIDAGSVFISTVMGPARIYRRVHVFISTVMG